MLIRCGSGQWMVVRQALRCPRSRHRGRYWRCGAGGVDGGFSNRCGVQEDGPPVGATTGGPFLASTTGRAGLAVAGSAGRQGPEACIRLVVVRGTRLAVVRGTRLAAWGLRTPG